MVRLILASANSVNEADNNVNFDVFPNPSNTGIFNINLDALKACMLFYFEYARFFKFSY